MSHATVGSARWAAQLLDVQMWCFGQDIQHKAGNILLRLGFCQNRARDTKQSTHYTALSRTGGTVSLWGFGMHYGEPDHGGVFLQRYRFEPRLTNCQQGDGIHDPKQLLANRPTTVSQMRQLNHLLPNLLGWVAHYEHWIAETYGTKYREAVLQARQKKSLLAAKELPKAWETLAKKASRHHQPTEQALNPWREIMNPLRQGLQLSARGQILRQSSPSIQQSLRGA